MLICLPKIPDNFADWSDVRVNLYEPLDSAYRALEEIPDKDFRLSIEAKQLWTRWQSTLKTGQRKHMQSNPALGGLLGKHDNHTLRIAMLLHCLEYACGDRTTPISRFIEAGTMQRAITLSRYYCGQFLLLQGHTCGEDDLPRHLLKIWELAKRSGGTLKNREVISGIYWKKRPKSAEVQKMFEAIARPGHCKN